MNYTDAIKIITKKQSLGIKPGLERISKLLDIMDNPQESLKIIHVAGTNGKGTVCATIADALKNRGLKVGLFTSPWIDDYREQIQINNKFIPKDKFANYVEKYGDCDATEFELLTAIMFKYFEDEKVDFAVVECGMGGKDDSTNVISSPILEIITSVSMDHTDFLGDTLEKIAEQKAGIIKPESAVVLYPNKSVNHIFEDYAKKVNAKVISVGENGDYQKNNLALVNTALKYLNFSPVESVVKLGARQEIIGKNIMLDGAHNVGGALALEKNLPKDREITAVIGMMRDKDVNSYLKIISAYCRRIIATQPSYYRAMTAEDLADAARKYCGDVTVVKNPHDAVKIKDYDFLLVCGSFFLARDVRKELL